MLEPRPPAVLDLSAWVRKARLNPVLYRQRQVTEILLHAIAATPGLEEGLFLKGGILMALAYGSPRVTGDVDFSVLGNPVEMEQQITKALDTSLRQATRKTGHLDLDCRVQRVERKPRPTTFAESPFPALEITIGFAVRTSQSDMARLEAKRSPRVLRIDLSFCEPIDSVQRLIIDDGVIQAYGLYDLIAEKLRAMLQQKTRPHPGSRRQDVYDICRLIKTFEFDQEEEFQILGILRHKSRERSFEPTQSMIADAAIVNRLRADWPTLEAELDEPLPDFDEYFGIVMSFYQGLPWQRGEKVLADSSVT